MAQGNPNPPNQWKPGASLNPNGRPVGSRNIRTQEVLDKIKALGFQDPLVTLAQLQANSNDEAIRATAANMLAPYLHSKNATKPVQPDPVYFETEKLPRPANIREACSNVALLSEMKATGQLDVVTADSLINDQRIILNAMVDEAKLLAANPDPSQPQQIVITGGLPELPGTQVIMPQLNGHHLELEASKDPINGPANPQTEDQSKRG
jgi:hypothetical protein